MKRGEPAVDAVRSRITVGGARFEVGAEFSFGVPRALFSGPFLQSRAQGELTYDVAPDGRFLMILPGNENAAAASASIVVVENFGEELKRRVRPSVK
jgi:hypothetical protein